MHNLHIFGVSRGHFIGLTIWEKVFRWDILLEVNISHDMCVKSVKLAM